MRPRFSAIAFSMSLTLFEVFALLLVLRRFCVAFTLRVGSRLLFPPTVQEAVAIFHSVQLGGVLKLGHAMQVACERSAPSLWSPRSNSPRARARPSCSKRVCARLTELEFAIRLRLLAGWVPRFVTSTHFALPVFWLQSEDALVARLCAECGFSCAHPKRKVSIW